MSPNNQISLSALDIKITLTNMQIVYGHVSSSQYNRALSEPKSSLIVRMHQDIKADFISSETFDKIWSQIDVTRSGRVSLAQWQMWAKSRWPFVSTAVASQAYQRTLAATCRKRQADGAAQPTDVCTRAEAARLVQTLPICCEAEEMFFACDADGDHRVSVAELKVHAKAHGLKLNADQLKTAVEILSRSSSFSAFCDWFLQQRGGDTAEEIAAVCCMRKRVVIKCVTLRQVRLQTFQRGKRQRQVTNVAYPVFRVVLNSKCSLWRQRERRNRP